MGRGGGRKSRGGVEWTSSLTSGKRGRGVGRGGEGSSRRPHRLKTPLGNPESQTPKSDTTKNSPRNPHDH